MTKRLTVSFTALAVLGLSQGCATRTQSAAQAAEPSPAARAADTAAAAPAATCVGPQCASQVMQIAQHTEVAVEKNAPPLKDHPLTSVVVTQCNLLVAVYMTMPDGRLLRYDHSAKVPAEQLLSMAYTATRSERVEVSCNGEGAAGYEKHDPV